MNPSEAGLVSREGANLAVLGRELLKLGLDQLVVPIVVVPAGCTFSIVEKHLGRALSGRLKFMVRRKFNQSSCRACQRRGNAGVDTLAYTIATSQNV